MTNEEFTQPVPFIHAAYYLPAPIRRTLQMGQYLGSFPLGLPLPSVKNHFVPGALRVPPKQIKGRENLFEVVTYVTGWLGSRVVSVLDSVAEGPGFKSQSRRCRVTVLRKLFTPIVPLFTKQ